MPPIDDKLLNLLNETLTTLASRDKDYIKERAEHIRDVARMNTAIEALTESNKKVNDSITELIAQNRQSETKIDLLKELILTKDSEHKTHLCDLERRVEVIEEINTISATEKRINDRRMQFWHSNWFNILQVLVVIVTVCAVMYATFLKGKI